MQFEFSSNKDGIHLQEGKLSKKRNAARGWRKSEDVENDYLFDFSNFLFDVFVLILS